MTAGAPPDALVGERRAHQRLSPRLRLVLAAAAWLVATALVLVALRAVGWRAALHAVRAAQPGWLAAAVLCHGSIIALWAWQTYVLLPRGAPAGRARRAVPNASLSSGASPTGARPTTYATVFEVQALTATATNTVPAFLGQATGVALLRERAGVDTAGALGVFAQHNLVEGVAKLATLFAAASVAPLPPRMRDAVTVLAVCMAVFTVALAIAAWAATRQGAPDRAQPDLTAGPHGVLARLRGLVVRWAASLDALRDPRRLALALVIALLMKGAEASGWWAVEHAFGVSPRPGSPVLALAATNLASAIPASPGNLGVYEGAAYSAYHGLLGVPRETAFALALVGHVCYLLPLVGLGWLMLSRQQLAALRARRARTAPGPRPPADPPAGPPVRGRRR